jgi:hypothetical protein
VSSSPRFDGRSPARRIASLAVLAISACAAAAIPSLAQGGRANTRSDCSILATREYVQILVTGSGAVNLCRTSVHVWNADLADSNNCLPKGGAYGCGYVIVGRWYYRTGLHSHGPLTNIPPAVAIGLTNYLLRFGSTDEGYVCSWRHDGAVVSVYDTGWQVNGREICRDMHAGRWP